MTIHTEDALDLLLRFIRGEGEFKWYGKGMTTWPNAGDQEKRKHEGCLILESRGLIQRKQETNDYVVWSPVESACKTKL